MGRRAVCHRRRTGPGVTATADALDAALDKAYEAVGEIRFENAHYRKDIGRTR